MKKYISVFIITAMLVTAFAGFGGSALAGPGDAIISLSTTTLTAKAGDSVNITANFTNGSAERFSNYRIKIRDYGITFEQGAPLESGDTARDIPVSFTVTGDMLGQVLTFAAEYQTEGSPDWKAGNSVDLKINTAESSPAIACTVTVDHTQVDPGGLATFTYNIQNQGNVTLDNIEVKTDTLNKGKALHPAFSLNPGKSFTFAYKHTFTTPVTVNSYITYTVSGSSETQRYNIPGQIKLEQTIREVKTSLSVDNSKPNPGEEVTFTLKVKNEGTMQYKNLVVTCNGQEMSFPTRQLNSKDEYEKQYKMTFDLSTDVKFTLTMKDLLGQTVSVSTNTIRILLPVDPTAIKNGLKLVIEPDRDLFTSAGVVNFSGYIANDSIFTLSNVTVKDTALGLEVFSISEMDADSKLPISFSVDVNETTTYNFEYSVADRNGDVYTVKADPITITIQGSEEVTANPIDDAPTITLPPDGGSSDPLGIWGTIAIVLIVMIIGVGIALIILWRNGRTPSKAPRAAAPRAKRPVRSGYSKSVKSRSYRDRNNF